MRKNVAVKLDESVHSQLSVLAQLAGEGTTVPDVIRLAVDEHLARKRSELAGRADEVVAAIEREASVKKSAMQALFGSASSAGEATKSRNGRRPAEVTADQ